MSRRVEVLVEGRTLFSDGFSLGLSSVCLVSGGSPILVDTGHGGHRRALNAAFDAHGIECIDIETVVLTHLHWDHMLNLDMFPHARLVVHRLEVEAARTDAYPDFARPAYAAQILKGRHVEQIGGDVELDEGVRLVETPGHSAGHVAVIVGTGADAVAIAGDAIPDRMTAVTGKNPFGWHDSQRADESVARLTGESAHIVPGHDQAFACAADMPYKQPERIFSLGTSVTEPGLTVRLDSDNTMSVVPADTGTSTEGGGKNAV